jgi:hypothetical protein
MKVLTTTSNGRPMSFVCNNISRVEESFDEENKTMVYSGNDMLGILVDMSYLEVVGFLKSVE